MEASIKASRLSIAYLTETLKILLIDTITKAVADITQHIFNHQTHHRGQLTCVLSQLGIDYGCMDLPVIVAEGSR